MSRTVLVVDDSPTELKLMTMAIDDGDYNIVTASSGDEAIDKAHQIKPDLILLDVVMPGKDGFTVCRELIKDPETKDIPIVMVTTKSQETDKFWGKKQGAKDYVTKPFDPMQLADSVRRNI